MGMVFCRGCGKEIHESAPICPHCGAPQGIQPNPVTRSKPGKVVYTSYDQVPWYRKIWFAIVCALIFSPITLILLLTGDIYYRRRGQLKTYSKGTKISLIVLIIGGILIGLLRAFVTS